MKTLLIGLIAASLTFNSHLHAEQSAQTRLFCLSIRFDQANAGGPNGIYSLDLTGIDFGINGELFPISDTAPSHASFVVLTDEIFEDEIPGTLLLDVPKTDLDGDGFSDIYDTSKAFSGTSSGSYSFSGFASGTVTATWSREAGSKDGTCLLNFKNLGEPFFHIFTVMDYRGTVNYTPGSTDVSAHVNLALSGVPESELKGPMSFTKSIDDPFNLLDYDADSWTNSLVQPEEIFSFVNDSIFRDPAWPTNYYGNVEFDDWFLATEEPDYYLWILSIDDLNDSDHDGIPDFSDDPGTVEPVRPVLSVTHNSGNVLLGISGNVGQICEIQELATLGSTWSVIQSVTLTNASQTVSLPLPPSGTRFWRVRTP